jgi:hypothetical protein
MPKAAEQRVKSSLRAGTGHRNAVCAVAGLAVLLGTASVRGAEGDRDVPVAAPAAEAAEPSAPAAGPRKPGDASTGRRLSYELPAVEVVGEPMPTLREEERIGEYEQPRWTAHRRFPTTRIYVIPKGQVDVEYWLRVKNPRGGKPVYEHRQEIEIGLPYRFQFDFYLIETHEGSGRTFVDQSFELRYAFAKWGSIPGNPTVYYEFIHRDDRPEKFELKFLFGDEFAPRWHWGTNLIWESELGDAREQVVEWTPAVSYTVVDEVLSVGVEGKFEIASERPHTNKWHENLRLGPSLQWRPIPRMHINVAPLVGLNSDSSYADTYFIVGWEF